MFQFWDFLVNLFGYDTTMVIKNIIQSLTMLLGGFIIGGFFVTRFHHNLVQSPEIDKLGTMKLHGRIVSRPTTVWETIDTLTAIIVITISPKRGLVRRDMRRSKVIGRILWIFAAILIIFSFVMCSFIILDPYRY